MPRNAMMVSSQIIFLRGLCSDAHFTSGAVVFSSRPRDRPLTSFLLTSSSRPRSAKILEDLGPCRHDSAPSATRIYTDDPPMESKAEGHNRGGARTFEHADWLRPERNDDRLQSWPKARRSGCQPSQPSFRTKDSLMKWLSYLYSASWLSSFRTFGFWACGMRSPQSHLSTLRFVCRA